MEAQSQCHSCSMPIEAGPLCEHCSSDSGELLPFEECFERFIQWIQRQESGLGRDAAERKTLEFMSNMPAWAGNPELAARLERS